MAWIWKFVCLHSYLIKATGNERSYFLQKSYIFLISKAISHNDFISPDSNIFPAKNWNKVD